MLSQLKLNETLIRELQGQAENDELGVLGEQAASDPGSSSLRNLFVQPSLGPEPVNLTVPRASGSSDADQTRQKSLMQGRPDGLAGARDDGSPVHRRRHKRQRDHTKDLRRRRIQKVVLGVLLA